VKAPAFWQQPAGTLAAFLAPAAALYAAATARRVARAPDFSPPVPVICVGNLSAGGTGKTPVVQYLIARLSQRGVAAHVVSRGFGGSLKGPLRVDPARHSASEVGDEPLLLAASAPVWIGRDRAAAARGAVEAGAALIILDDGFQNPGLRKDLSLIVVDGGAGFGNGRVIPAGPLREPIEAGLARASAVVVMGADERHVAASVAVMAPALPVLAARLQPVEAMRYALAGRRVMAFAGIGRPEKFYATLKEMGAELLRVRSFGDHEPIAPQMLERLVREAQSLDAMLVTTTKDGARLSARQRLDVVEVGVEVSWAEPEVLDSLLDRLLAAPA
jgi:tetraacyldisaccharide 4'-kinase